MRIRVIEQGNNGRDQVRYSDGAATPGKDAESVSQTISSPVTMEFDSKGYIAKGQEARSAIGTAVEIGSVGGDGGAAGDGDGRIVGKPGGNGGNVSVVFKSDVTGTYKPGPETAEILVQATRTRKERGRTIVEHYKRPAEVPTVTLPTLPLIFVYSVGGNGGTSVERVGQGGNGGNVEFTLAATASANTRYAPIALIRSAGGADHTYKSGVPHGSFAQRVNVDTGGHGGLVKVDIAAAGKISSTGTGSPGLVAESRGGHGGTTGNALGSAPHASRGGNGGRVIFESDGQVSTKGAQSIAVILQSIGGLGGDNTALSGGHAGANGGNANTVEATMSATSKISTLGEYSFGIIAQSIGGAGGKGAPGFLVGGDGGAAGNGNMVTLNHAGTITTKSLGSIGILAQSTGGGTGGAMQVAKLTKIDGGGGGGGGAGGFLFFGGGGQGGKGGEAGRVTVNNSGSITTSGQSAFGLLAQSIGGSGGGGGEGSSYGFLLGGSKGGTGGGGGDGGAVVIGSDRTDPTEAVAPPNSKVNQITTGGKGASAIVGQSIGGGGGVGGSANTKAAGVFASVAIAVGGKGGKGGDGATAHVYNSSSLSTKGISAHGLEVRSLGGGGGKAGDAAAYAISGAPPGYPSVSFSFAIGGAGGDGGKGDMAKAVNRADITTNGTKSYGIFANSIGGGGGTGGSAEAIADTVGLYKNLDVAVALGGTAGGGGGGGKADVINASTVTTLGDFSTAVLATSVGGGGGDGGLGTSSTEKSLSSYIENSSLGAVNAGKTLGISASLGGSGGKGGTGGQVTVQNYSVIESKGVQAAGIFAQSVGGGGGLAGGYLSKGSKEIALNIGGSRSSEDADGGGGAGGTVTITNESKAEIKTKGAGSTAIFAQSVGGGGGIGGSWGGTKEAPKLTASTVKSVVKVAKTGWTVWNGKLFEEKEKLEPAIQLARKAAAMNEAKGIWNNLTTIAGAGSAFHEVLKRDIQDQLKPIIGEIRKQSSFPVTLSVALGGSGGKGGAGGNVTVTNDGSLITEGGSAYGILGQSIGGGGGFGGGAVGSGSSTYNAHVNIGGSGGESGNGSRATVENSGTITTTGAASIGMFGQSIGGGGGVGGAAANASVFSGAASISLGGASGKQSTGGIVTANNSGEIRTEGKEAHGLVGQSVGGGGGVYFAKKEGIIDSAEIMNLINEDPEFKDKQITEAQAKVLTESLLEWLNVGTPQAKVGSNRSQIFDSFSVTAKLGGRNFTGGDAGSVNITHAGKIGTEGIGAFGIFAQSVGGGGGFGKDASVLDSTRSTWSIGGTDGAKGDGGNVTVTFAKGAEIETAGDGATGVFLQSIGGGGGYGGSGSGSFSIVDATAHTNYVSDPDFPWMGTYETLYYGARGNGGAINVVMQDGSKAAVSIATNGLRAHGIFAQSLGAGGGFAFLNNGSNLPVSTSMEGRTSEMVGSGGPITVTTRGSIRATGADSYGVFLQSGVQKKDGTLDRARNGNQIKLTHSGTIKGGSGSGAGVRIDGGMQNEIRFAKGSHVSAESGSAVMGSYARELLENSGLLIGDVDLISGGTTEANVFENTADGTYQSGNGNRTLKLGLSSTFNNEGTIDIAGVDRIGSLTLPAGLTTKLGGRLRTDVNSVAGPGKPDSDRLFAEDLSLKNLWIHPYAVEGLLPGQFTVISAKRPDDTFRLSDNPASVRAHGYEGSPVHWSVSRSGGDMIIKPSAKFLKAAERPLTPTEQSMVANWQQGWDSSHVDKAGLFAKLANVTSLKDYQTAIDSASPEGHQQVAVTQTMGARTSMNSALSCPIFVDRGTMIGESQCVWSRITGSRERISNSAATDGFTQSGIDVRIGGQWEISQGWFLGATAAYLSKSGSSSDGFTSTDGTGGDVSFALKHQVGPWYFAGSAHLGYTSTKLYNHFDVGDAIWNSQSDTDVWAGGLRGRVAYEFAFPKWYVRPFVDVDLIYTAMSDYDIKGELFSMRVDNLRDWTLAVRPAVEVGTRIDFANANWLRPFASIGLSYLSHQNHQAKIEMYDRALDGPSFTSTPVMPDKLLDVGVGLQYFAEDKYELRGEYKAQVGDKYLGQEGSVRFSVRF